MTRDELLTSLFPLGHEVKERGKLVFGSGVLDHVGPVAVIGVTDKAHVGVDEALLLSDYVLQVLQSGDKSESPPKPILVLVDSDSQRMSKRDELMGLSQFLSHLAVCLRVADGCGHHTVGILYGNSAAGAFIATVLATRTLVALPGAHPSVMDLASMAKVTKLPLEILQSKAQGTSVFAPGLTNMVCMGAIASTLDPLKALGVQIKEVLSTSSATDTRDQLGMIHGGRHKAASIAERVYVAAASAS